MSGKDDDTTRARAEDMSHVHHLAHPERKAVFVSVHGEHRWFVFDKASGDVIAKGHATTHKAAWDAAYVHMRSEA